MTRILLIDDEPEFSEELSRQLRQCGYQVQWLDLAEAGLQLLASDPFDLVLLDNKMPRMSGLEFLAALKERGIVVPVILMTSAPNDRTAIQATNLGAFDFVIKPLDYGLILSILRPVIDKAKMVRRPEPVPLPVPHRSEADDDSLIVGRGPKIQEVFKRIGKVIQNVEPVLILGETGTGKELVAQAIHTNSARKKMPFVIVNCPALSKELLEDELFGHEKDAYTGATKMRKGCFEHASGGTLFLDEVGDMPLDLQAKLLRALENRTITRIGSNDPIAVDVRILAATNKNLATMVHEGTFREDLFFRLEGETIHLPPLRQRPEDVEPLARRILSQTPTTPRLHPDALEVLRNHFWRGNIRQMQKVLRRAALSCRGSLIVPEDLDFGELDPVQLPPALGATTATSSEDAATASLRKAIAWAWQNDQPKLLPLLQQMLERELLRYALAQPGMSQVQLARKLGMARGTLRARLEKYGLEAPDEASS